MTGGRAKTPSSTRSLPREQYNPKRATKRQKRLYEPMFVSQAIGANIKSGDALLISQVMGHEFYQLLGNECSAGWITVKSQRCILPVKYMRRRLFHRGAGQCNQRGGQPNVAGKLRTLQQKGRFYVALELVSNVVLFIRQFDSTCQTSCSRYNSREAAFV